jgi:hypothetical protein
LRLVWELPRPARSPWRWAFSLHGVAGIDGREPVVHILGDGLVQRSLQPGDRAFDIVELIQTE